METRELETLADVHDLVAQAQSSDEPVIVFDGEDECLIAMRPPVFERILFDTDLLNSAQRETLHV